MENVISLKRLNSGDSRMTKDKGESAQRTFRRWSPQKKKKRYIVWTILSCKRRWELNDKKSKAFSRCHFSFVRFVKLMSGQSKREMIYINVLVQIIALIIIRIVSQIDGKKTEYRRESLSAWYFVGIRDFLGEFSAKIYSRKIRDTFSSIAFSKINPKVDRRDVFETD